MKKKIEKKEQTIKQNLVRVEHVKDAFESVGGSQAFITSEIQSLGDLRRRYVAIRGAIAKANLENRIQLENFDLTIADWLVWKREVAQNELNFFNLAHQSVKNELDRASKQPQAYKDEKGESHFVKVVANADYPTLVKRAETLQTLLDQLDGKLSLKNATVMVEV